MIGQVLKAGYALNTMIFECTDLARHRIAEEERKSAARVCEFLGTAALAMEQQSERYYPTLSFTIKHFVKLKKVCSEVIKRSHRISAEVVAMMEKKLQDYESHLKNSLAHFAKVVDLRFSNDIQFDIDVLRDDLHVYPSIPTAEDHVDTECDVELNTPERSLLKRSLDGSSLQGFGNDDVAMFLLSTSKCGSWIRAMA